MKLTIGCHLSIAKGFYQMGREAVAIGANTMQFFIRNPRGGGAKNIQPADVDAFTRLAAAHDLHHFLVHAPYTLNPCSNTERTREFAHLALSEDLVQTERFFPGSCYNFHPGSHVGQGTAVAIALTSGLLNRILSPDMSTCVLLETMAGKGSEIGSRFEELRAIIDQTEHAEKLGVCLDTCHVFSAGYDIVHNLDGVLDAFDRTIGLERLKAIHLAESQMPIGSHKDRHAPIGKGYIGLSAFEKIISHPQLKKLPFYLETPLESDGHAEEIALLRRMSK